MPPYGSGLAAGLTAGLQGFMRGRDQRAERDAQAQAVAYRHQQDAAQAERQTRQDAMERERLDASLLSMQETRTRQAAQDARQAEQDGRTRASFAMEANEKGYTPYQEGTTPAPPDTLKAAGLDLYGDVGPNQYEAKAKQQAAQMGGFVKSHLTAAESLMATRKDSARALAKYMGIPDAVAGNVDPAVIEKAYATRIDAPKRQYDAARGVVVDTETGRTIDGQPIPAKPVNEIALAGREAQQATREENTKNRFVGATATRYQNNPMVKRATTRADILNQVMSLIEMDNPISDLGLQTEVLKLFDPMHIVTDDASHSIRALQGASDRVKQMAHQFNTGMPLSDQQKGWIKEIAINEIKNGDRQIAPLQRNLGAQLRQRGYAADSAATLPSPFEAIPRDYGKDTKKPNTSRY